MLELGNQLLWIICMCYMFVRLDWLKLGTSVNEGNSVMFMELKFPDRVQDNRQVEGLRVKSIYQSEEITLPEYQQRHWPRKGPLSLFLHLKFSIFHIIKHGFCSHGDGRRICCRYDKHL